MEKLHKRSDGIAETPSGNFAIIPRRFSGKSEELKWFEFRTSTVAEVTRVEWPASAPFIITEADVAVAMVRLGYAVNVTQELVDRYNVAVEEHEKAAGKAPAKPDPAPASPAAAPAAPAAEAKPPEAPVAPPVAPAAPPAPPAPPPAPAPAPAAPVAPPAPAGDDAKAKAAPAAKPKAT